MFDVVLDLVLEAIFSWQQLKDYTLYIGYPSRGRVIEVCVDDDPCFIPTSKQIECLWREGPVFKVTILRELEGKFWEETLVWAPPSEG